MTQGARSILGYAVSALLLLWPSVRSGGRFVPGTERGDLWNGLWSFWAFGRDDADHLLGFPDGGVVAVADQVNSWLIHTALGGVDVAFAWALVVFVHVVLAGWFVHLLAVELGIRGVGAWLAGLSYQWAPVQISGLHNGSTEAVSAGWLAAALLCVLWALKEREDADRLVAIRCVVAGLVGALCVISNWYAGVCLGLLLLGLAIHRRTKRSTARLIGVGLVLMGIAWPVAAQVHSASTGAESVVRIKLDRETELVRRTIGAVDPVVFIRPGDFRSPDFRVLSRYGEDFIHSSYLGLSVLFLAAVGWWRLRNLRWLGGVALCTALLALGPVLVSQGQPALFLDQRGIPLPYFLLESLPGFSSLSLLYRFTQGVSLALSLLAGAALLTLWPNRAHLRWAAVAFVVFEFVVLAPTAGLPHFSDAQTQPVFEDLKNAPPGAVMNFPVVGGRRYLFEQTMHEKPLAASLNFPNNPAAQRGWDTLDTVLHAQEGTPSAGDIAGVMEPLGLRYIVVHHDPLARPDMHDRIVQQLGQVLQPLAQEDNVAIYALW